MNQKGFISIVLFIFVIALVGVAGYFVVVKNYHYIDQSAPTPQSPPSTSKQSTPTQNDKIMDWKIYQNDKYGFEIKYPRSHELVTSVAYFVPKEDYDMPPEQQSLVLLRLTDPNDNLEFYVLPNTEKLTPKDFAERIIRKPCLIEKSEVIFNSITAYELKISAYYGAYDDVPEQKTTIDQACDGEAVEKIPKKRIIFVPLKVQDKILRISYYVDFGHGRTSPSEETLNTVDKILSTFKFTK